MSKRYFSSDFHFGSTNINKYASRPFSSAEEALNAIGHGINDNLSSEDVLIHAGDFCLLKSDRHDVVEDVGLPYKLNDYLKMLKPNMFLLAGNHDISNCAEPFAKNMVLDLNQNYRNVYVNHFPSDNSYYHGLTGNEHKIQINLCGHVHNAWVVHYDYKKYVLNVNVGVDAWGYKPVSDVELTEFLDWIFDINNTGNGADFTSSWSWTNKDVIAFKSIAKFAIEKRREARKQERYEKKGLTPEECERRKLEAMRKKGLIK